MLVVVVLGWSLEAWLRSAGFAPSVESDGLAWLSARARLGPESTVLIGTSRMQSNVDPVVWGQTLGGLPPVNLALVGASAKPVLEALSLDPDYRGLIVYDVVPRFFFSSSAPADQVSLDLIERYDAAKHSLGQRLEMFVNDRIAGRFVLLSPEFRITRLVEALMRRERLAAPRWSVRADRFMALDASRITEPVSAAGYEALYFKGRQPSGDDVGVSLRRVDKAVQRHLRKGGMVVFVAMPACGEIRGLEQGYFPDSLYWSRLEAEVRGMKIRSYDHPELLQFTCADGSHLDFRDVMHFTRGLARLVRESDVRDSAKQGSNR